VRKELRDVSAQLEDCQTEEWSSHKVELTFRMADLQYAANRLQDSWTSYLSIYNRSLQSNNLESKARALQALAEFPSEFTGDNTIGECLQQAIELRRSLGDIDKEALLHILLARRRAKAGDLQSALDSLETASMLSGKLRTETNIRLLHESGLILNLLGRKTE